MFDRWIGAAPQPRSSNPKRFSVLELDEFVFQHQFFTLEFAQFQPVGCGMGLFDFDLLFDRLVAPDEFDEMTLQRHPDLRSRV